MKADTVPPVSLNVKQENEIMAKAVAGVKNINISKPTIKVKNITFERKTTVIAGKSLKENVVQRTALGELSNKILSRDEDSTSTTSIVKKEVVKTRSLAVATIHNVLPSANKVAAIPNEAMQAEYEPRASTMLSTGRVRAEYEPRASTMLSTGRV
uniref:Uncharacterized protein n=1 Tax=Timema monikensis TaxID=170555 RepID=A0A7R9HPF6_9NEOP|nr:unnamed protein product [Timema monikensis]